jgi:hypothetical protein
LRARTLFVVLVVCGPFASELSAEANVGYRRGCKPKGEPDMRLVLKLGAIALLGVSAQCALIRFAGTLDEGLFVFRVMVAQAGGAKVDDEMIMDQATRLAERQWRRSGLAPPSVWQAEQMERMRLASAADAM